MATIVVATVCYDCCCMEFFRAGVAASYFNFVFSTEAAMFTSHCRCINCITPPHILSGSWKTATAGSATRRCAPCWRPLACAGSGRFGSPCVGRDRLLSRSPHRVRVRQHDVSCLGHHGTQRGRRHRRRRRGEPGLHGLGDTCDFYQEVFIRDSMDERGMRLNGYVHFGSRATTTRSGTAARWFSATATGCCSRLHDLPGCDRRTN